MAVFRGHREMEVEDLNIDEAPTMYVQTKTPDQAEEKTPKSGMIEGVCLCIIIIYFLINIIISTASSPPPPAGA